MEPKSKYNIESAPKKGKGIRFALYGVEGIGKSTLASQMPSPIFISVGADSTRISTRKNMCGRMGFMCLGRGSAMTCS